MRIGLIMVGQVEIQIMNERQCLGLSKNWRRCGRYVHGKWFCDDHKKQPLILIVFIIFTAIPAYITIHSYLLPQSSSDIYNIKNNINYYNSAPQEIKKTVNVVPTNKTPKGNSTNNKKIKTDDSINLQVFNSTSGVMENVKPNHSCPK